jgi:hypothetical protein
MYFFVYFGLFQNKTVCFETGPKQTETNFKKIVFGFAKQTEINWNRSSFSLFRFEQKIVCLFQGHPTGTDTSEQK